MVVRRRRGFVNFSLTLSLPTTQPSNKRIDYAGGVSFFRTGFTQRSQFIDRRLCVIRAENRRSRDTDIHARLCADRNRALGDTAVDLNERMQPAGEDLFFEEFHLRHHVRHEALTAEARLDRHHQNHVQPVEIRQNDLGRGARLDRESGLYAALFDKAERFFDVAVTLDDGRR